IQSVPVETRTAAPAVETPKAETPKARDAEIPVWPPHVVPKINVPIMARSAGAAHHDMIGEDHLTMLEDKGLLPRLADELGTVAHNYQLTWPEFKRDPFGFMKRSVQGYGKMVGGFLGA